jgi:sugar phosphate isomerase/epimerase
MQRIFSLAHLTVPDLHPVDMAEVAGRTGYTHIGLRMTPVTLGGWHFPLMSNRVLFRDTRAAMADAGVGLLDVELLRLGPETEVADYEPLLAVSAELGAKRMLTQIHDPDYGRGLANLAKACDLAAQFGLTCELEFLPWTHNRSLETAARFVREVDKPNAGVMIDTLHFDRALSKPAEIRALPPQWFRFIQLCDAPAERPTTLEGLLLHAREARDFPGRGGLDLKAVLRELPSDIPIGLEIPNTELDRRMTVAERVGQALEATKVLLRELEAETAVRPAAAGRVA